MDKDQTLSWIKEVRRAIRKMDQWADKKIDSQVQVSKREVELIERVLKQLAGLKKTLNDLRDDNEQKSDPPPAEPK